MNGGMLEGAAYSDGSFLDGPIPELARGGWAFAVLDEDGIIVASAYGVPPPWIKYIDGAEAWGCCKSAYVPFLARSST